MEAALEASIPHLGTLRLQLSLPRHLPRCSSLELVLAFVTFVYFVTAFQVFSVCRK